METSREQDTCMYVIGWIFIAAFAVAAVIFYTNGDWLRSVMPICIFHAMTGYYCPGCGGTRSVYALLQGHLIQSFLYQPFVLYTAVLGGWFMISQTIERLSRGRVRIALRFRAIYAYIAIGLILVACLVKNLIIVFTGVHVMD